MQLKPILSGLGATVTAAFAATTARAQDALSELPIIGAPVQGGVNFQPAATELMRDLVGLDNILLVIITAITIFVTALLVWMMIRYNQRRNPKPANFSHNSPLEIAWTIVPILILVFIGAFSLPVLFKQQTIPQGDINIKVTGYQWYWGYEYTDETDAQGNPVDFMSYMIGGENGIVNLNDDIRASLAAAGYADEHFTLATDTAVVVPVGKTVVMNVTAADVIHSWTIPAFGVKQDAVPGRIAQLWFNAEQEGVYFGQCSELCGIAHAYMPITVKVVSEEVYAEWLERVKTDSSYVAW